MDPFADLPVGLDHTAEVLAESILVQNPVIGIGDLGVPEPAGVGADFIGQQQFTAGAEAQLDLEIDQLQLQARKKRTQHPIHLAGDRFEALALLWGEQAQPFQARLT